MFSYSNKKYKEGWVLNIYKEQYSNNIYPVECDKTLSESERYKKTHEYEKGKWCEKISYKGRMI